MVDSEGNLPTFNKGDRVFVRPNKMEATVIEQVLHYDGVDYCFWGNVRLQYDDGVAGVSH